MSYEVGQKVVIFDRHNGDRFSEIVRVTKRFVETKGGSKWNHHGHPYPHQDWSTSHIAPVDEMAADTLERVRIGLHARRLGQVDWKELPLETLRKISALVKEATSS